MDKIIDIHKSSNIDQCHVIELGKNHHDNGNLTVIENDIQLPYKICRTYYLYDIPGCEERGGHSHKKCYEFLVAISGSFDVTVDDGKHKSVFPYTGRDDFRYSVYDENDHPVTRTQRDEVVAAAQPLLTAVSHESRRFVR